MTTSLLYSRSLHKHGGRGCTRSRNNMKKNEKRHADMSVKGVDLDEDK